MRFGTSWAGVLGAVCTLSASACSGNSAPPAAGSTDVRVTPPSRAGDAAARTTTTASGELTRVRPTANASSTAAAGPGTSTASPSTQSHWVGNWRSERCGARGYPRRLSIAQGGTVSGSELVSPCPPTARCVWSGVVPFSGTWSATAEDAITLKLTRRTGSGPAVQLPDRLLWDTASHAPAEIDGSTRCAYTATGASPKP